MKSKKTIIIYGTDSETMEAEAAKLREKHKTKAHIYLRSANHFTDDQVEACDEVIVQGKFKNITDAYKHLKKPKKK